VGSVPDRIAVRPRGPLDASVRVPGSRSLTNRALLAAALADGESELSGCLESDDTEAMRDCLAALGVRVEVAGDLFHVAGTGGRLAAPTRTLDVRYSGTTARFVTAAATLAAGPSLVDGEPRMRERPIDDLVHALVDLGAVITIEGRGGCPPLRVAGGGLPGGSAVIDGSRSSQYVSGVLLAAPCAARDVTLRVKDGVLVSRPYVEMTLAVMRAFGAEAGWRGDDVLHVTARPYRATRYAVEPDASSAAYPLAAAAIAGGRVRVVGLSGDSLQADVRFLDALEAMGCTVVRAADACEVRGPEGPLRAVDLDANDFPDAAMALAVVALFADGPSRIRNVGNLRIKETDRLSALETELRRLGAVARAGRDELVVEPAPGAYRGAAIETYDDHRMAMALALAGLRIPGVEILDPGCVRKTWPDYFDALERLS
jgi:3-phosphoshikimate 1-carboxyvinyltransferase